MVYTAKKLAQQLGGIVIGDANTLVYKMQGIESADSASLSFLYNPRYKGFLSTTNAAVVLVPEDLEHEPKTGQTFIKLKNVEHAVQRLSKMFNSTEAQPGVISKLSSMHSSVSIGEAVNLGDFTIACEGVEIGDFTTIQGQVYLGKDVKIGKNCTLYPGVKVYDACVIGDNVVIHSNAVIGSDGFGFIAIEGKFEKVQQLGTVIIEDDVEIGSNTVIDRAAVDSTIIKKGVKLDNLIQIAHSVEVGQNTVIAAQSGISGSTKIGENCQIGGQVGFAGHIEIADGSQIQAKSGIPSSIKEQNKKWYGYPAFSYFKYLRSYTVFKRLPDLLNEIRSLRKDIDKLKKP